MLDTFSKLSAVLKVNAAAVNIDTFVFKLHYRFTFCLLLGCTILVTLRQYFGDHINCYQSFGSIPVEWINTYCFTSTTFTVPRLMQAAEEDRPLYGLGPYTKDDDVTHHAYYQWVPFVLLGQALMFYAPHYLWKILENNKIGSIIQGMNVFTLLEQEKDGAAKEDLLADYIWRNLHRHNGWALRFFICRMLNAVNVIGQIFLTDAFLGGEFLRYGVDVMGLLEQEPESRVDPMARVFPRLTKCVYPSYGPSGTLQRKDALCILALNIINEKVYTLLWFWWLFLSVVTIVELVVAGTIVLLPPLRVVSLRAKLSGSSKKDAGRLMQYCSIGDWLLLDFLGGNMDATRFSAVVAKILQLAPLQPGTNVC